MSRLALALMLVARLALADELVPLRAGQAAPGDGVWLSTAQAMLVYERCELARRDAEAFEKALLSKPPPPTSRALLIAGGLGLVLGIGLMLLVRP